MSDFKAVQLKRSSSTGVVPSAAQLAEGELAINLADGTLYSKNSSNTVFQVIGAIEDSTITTNKINDDAVTLAKIADATIASITSTILNAAYPVGCLHTSTVATNPATTIGIGTWEAFGAGRVLIGDGGSFTAGATGGSADAIVVSHTHGVTVTDPGHNHTFPVGGQDAPYSAADAGAYTGERGTTDTKATGISVAISSTGSSGTNANLQPYIVVYMWKRTA